MIQGLSGRRLVALILVIAAFVALSAFALFARAYQPGRDAVAGNAISLLPPRTAAPIVSSTPIGATAGHVITVDGDKPNGAQPVPLTPPGSPASPSNDGPVALAACELGLDVPTRPAGLANLTPLVPLFGPFSPEAFAMVPAFLPGFPLLGPLVTTGGDFLTAHPEITTAAYDTLHPLETQGYSTIAPLYEPVRPQVLAGEEQLAAAIAPQVATFASLPGATCLPAALALLLS